MRYKKYASNSSRRAGPLLWDRWEQHAQERPQAEAVIHWDALKPPFRWTYSDLLRAASRVAGKLTALGVRRGDICALIARHHRNFYPVYMGISAAGAIPAVLAPPNPRLHPEKFVHGLSGIAARTGLDWVLTQRELDTQIKPLLLRAKSAVKGIVFPLEWENNPAADPADGESIRINRQKVRGSSPCLLQFSSGTTGLQKGVTISHEALLEHVRRYSEAIGISAKDKIVSWLPLYHDMGLIAAFHLPLAAGIPIIQLDPFQWVSAPSILFQAMMRETATLTWLPNFAYNLLSDRIREDEMADICLAGMRMFINCSEVVRAEAHEKFLARFGRCGVRPAMLGACYAMAEATFAVTQTEPGTEAVTFACDKHALSAGISRPARDAHSEKICVSSGKPISGCTLKIVDKKGRALPEGRVGMVAIKSVSLFNGYLKNPRKTRAVIKGGWYLSGDRGFCRQGEYYILGREDDLIIVAGENISPEDIEDAVGRVPDVLPGRVVAFGLADAETGTEKVCVAAETAVTSQEEKESLQMLIVRAGMEINVTISGVHLVSPRWLIKSSSGKLSRKTNKERVLKMLDIKDGILT
jgi:acyl-CoA synthetase (AMP-forming)/AMP-acid ligase II